MTSTRLSTIALGALALLCTLPAHPQAATPDYSRESSAAADLVREAVHFGTEKNFDAAIEKLDAARAINPRQAFLWSCYGATASARGKLDEAIEDFQRELVNHPDEDKVALLLVNAQIARHKPEDAMQTMRNLLSHDPGHEQATSRLAKMLILAKQYPEAEKILRNSLAAKPNNLSLQFLLATSLLHQGKNEEAIALLKIIVEKTDDPAVLNGAAYALADQDIDPALAEHAARRALTLIELQYPFVAPDLKSRELTYTLVSTWDTLGWALFREGKIDEAEPWIRAAWTNGLSAEAGYHLGMLLEKEKHPAGAMAVYQVALFGERSSNDSIAEYNITRQAALRQAGTPNQFADGKIAYDAQRTFKVPGPNTLDGRALVQIEFTSTGPSNPSLIKYDDKHDRLTGGEVLLNNINFKFLLPPGRQPTLTRRGILTCHPGTPCEFALLTARAALSN